MGRTLNEMLSSRSVDSQQRIQEMANELLLEVRLQALREELEVGLCPRHQPTCRCGDGAAGE